MPPDIALGGKYHICHHYHLKAADEEVQEASVPQRSNHFLQLLDKGCREIGGLKKNQTKNICIQIPTSQHSKSSEKVCPHLVIRTTTKSAKLFVWKSTSLQNNLSLSLSLSLFEILLPNTVWLHRMFGFCTISQCGAVCEGISCFDFFNFIYLDFTKQPNSSTSRLD